MWLIFKLILTALFLCLTIFLPVVGLVGLFILFATTILKVPEETCTWCKNEGNEYSTECGNTAECSGQPSNIEDWKCPFCHRKVDIWN